MARPASAAATNCVTRVASRAIASPFLLRRCRSTGRPGPQQIDEAAQLPGVQIGSDPPVHARARPVNHVVALSSSLTGAAIGRAWCRPHINVDQMLAALINQYRHGAPIQRIEPPPG